MKYKTTKCYLSSCYFIFLLLLGMLTWINGVSIHFTGKRRSEMQYVVCVISVVTEKKRLISQAATIFSVCMCCCNISVQMSVFIRPLQQYQC